ncbi:MAG: hypothetical protein NTX95_00390 [Actinobacteria bacterium]|nr:hypothetical protein [Actinomycetota bacterium]
MAALEAIDSWLTQLGTGWLFVAAIAALLGLRHATDPDHLTALVSLRLRGDVDAPHRLGFAWGLGHAVTMIVVGLPLILLAARLPERLQSGLEVAVGILIAALALRAIHAALHRRVEARPVRSQRGAFTIGLLHGAAGSTAIVALILTRVEEPRLACLSLLVIAGFTALSMAGCSWLVCRGLDHGMHRLDPRWIGGVGGALAFCFGVTYAVAAAGVAL